MSRPVKFRLWLAERREMVELDDMSVPMDMLERYAADDPDAAVEGPHIHLWSLLNKLIAETPDNALLQYTGRFDRDKKAIAEGDLVLHLYMNEVFVVEWDELDARFTIGDMPLREGHSLKVIGNRYENPEWRDGK